MGMYLKSSEAFLRTGQVGLRYSTFFKLIHRHGEDDDHTAYDCTMILERCTGKSDHNLWLFGTYRYLVVPRNLGQKLPRMDNKDRDVRSSCNRGADVDPAQSLKDTIVQYCTVGRVQHVRSED